PELPQWLADIIRPIRELNGDSLDDYARNFTGLSGVNNGSRGEPYAESALDGAVAELSSAPNGKRNETLNAVAFRLGRMIARDWIDEKSVVEALLDACDANKYLREPGHRATLKTIVSGLEAGKKTPHPNLPEREPTEGNGATLSGVSGLSGTAPSEQLRTNGE